ncbi:MAG TPA: zf-HC2 domain-containing protein, partial [Gemmatimonadaceae bacterium]
MSERDAHPDEGTIHAWLDRQLDDTSAATLEAHLQRCDECAERVAEARGLIAGASRILSSLDVGESPASDKPAVESWRPAVLPATRARSIPSFRLTPARSAIAAVLVVAVATAIV